MRMDLIVIGWFLYFSIHRDILFIIFNICKSFANFSNMKFLHLSRKVNFEIEIRIALFRI